MDGFIQLVRAVVVEAGLPNASIYCKPIQDEASADLARPHSRRRSAQPTDLQEITCMPSMKATILPGWFRAEKDWDMVIIHNHLLIAAIEFKSHVGSFGNNCNNRVEEALGNATDLLAAYREGAFQPSLRPWLGYLMLLEDSPGATRPVRVREPHFPVFPEFRNASYAERYNQVLTRLVRDRLYDSACFLMSSAPGGLAKGTYREPNTELGFSNFLASLLGHATAVARTQPQNLPGSTKRPRRT